LNDSLSQPHKLNDKVLDAQLVVLHQFAALFYYKFREFLAQKIKGAAPSLQDGKKKGQVLDLIVPDHAEETRLLHI